MLVAKAFKISILEGRVLRPDAQSRSSIDLPQKVHALGLDVMVSAHLRAP